MIINCCVQAIRSALENFSTLYKSAFGKDNLRVLFEVSELINQKKKKRIIAVELVRVLSRRLFPPVFSESYTGVFQG
jgi:hypothetical protein